MRSGTPSTSIPGGTFECTSSPSDRAQRRARLVAVLGVGIVDRLGAGRRQRRPDDRLEGTALFGRVVALHLGRRAVQADDDGEGGHYPGAGLRHRTVGGGHRVGDPDPGRGEAGPG